LIGVAEALVKARERGVDVKVVIDSDNMDNSAVNLLLDAGVAVGDEDPDFMHNKFMIVDNRLIWTGSMNPTSNGVNENNNNVVVIVGSPELIEDYEAEFNELWNGIFGGGEAVPYPEIEVNVTLSLEVYFAPEDDVEDQIIEEINSAETAIYFATFTFTSQNIANALIQEHNEGVVINGIYESFQSGGYSTYSLLLNSGIEVIKDGNPAVMHNKLFIIDNYTVITAAEFKKLWKQWYTPTPTPTPTPSSNVVISYVHYDAEGNDNENLNDEYVVIRNEGNVDVDLIGWKLKDEANHVFTFPSFTLKPGATVTVHTGSGTNTQTDLYWGKDRAVWNNDHDTAYLYDSSMNLIDQESW